MLLKSPFKSRERILAYGGPGAGKTTCYFHIAQHTAGKMWVIDTDQTTQRFLESEEFGDLEDRFEIREPFSWEEWIEAAKEFRAEAAPDDFVVVDMMGSAWEEVQNSFSEKVYGVELADHWLAYMEKLKAAEGRGSKSPFDGTTDWQAVKRMYGQFTGNILRTKAHLFLVAGEKKINEQFDGSGVMQVGGMKPDAEKNTAHMVSTVLRLAGQRMTTGKDRQREVVKQQSIGDFGLDYLLGVAGWKIEGKA